MPILSRAQETGRRKIIAAATSGCQPDELGKLFLEAVNVAVPSDGQWLFGVDPSTLLFNRLLATSEGDGLHRREWLRTAYLKDFLGVRYFHPPALMAQKTTSVLCVEQQDRSLGIPMELRQEVDPSVHTQAFHDSRSPAGGWMWSYLGVQKRSLGMLTIVRRKSGNEFRPTDFTFLHLIGPTMSRALEVALARELASKSVGADIPSAASGILLVSKNHRVEFATPAGEAWLQRLRDPGHDGQPPLPTAVWAAIAGLTEPGKDRFVCSVTTQSASGPIRVEASPADDEGRIAIVLAPVKPPEPPAVPTTWPLTGQERKVVECLLGGLSNQNISSTLLITENTVEAHLAHIYDKLEVRSRLELLARLFRDTGWASFGLSNHPRSS
jgi:DNA-binding CsgD family transcriptional regulator